MINFILSNISAIITGIIAAIVIISILGYVVDWILTFIFVTNARVREFVMISVGFFAGMAIIVLLTGYT